MTRREILWTVILLSAFMACWVGYDKGVQYLLLPISLPAYIWLAATGKSELIILPLGLYAIGLVILFSKWIMPFGKRVSMALVVILFILHAVVYQAMLKAFREMGRGIVEQMLR
ncbi:MAG: hypothetical protein MN733_25585 [Nitrososphaera sp.]|nr:hypothetical protein [Nitrososphaera sp.]